MRNFTVYNPKRNIIIYDLVWGLILFGATFPKALAKFDFGFITNKQEDIIMSYVFALAMIIVIHLFDTVFILSTCDIDNERLKRGTIFSFLCLSSTIIMLAFSISVDSDFAKILFFILSWISIISLKYFSLEMAMPSVIEAKKIDNASKY